ncbi:MAG: hypothetical protein JXR58_11005 [Bacteroidales bacterium]|nr:hypothetical protein [Bacteroidales bacterium]
MKILLFISFFSVITLKSYSQEAFMEKPKVPIPLSIALTNNSTQLPGSGTLGVLHTPVHPGITLGTYKLWSAKAKHAWLQSLKLAYFYHHYSQHAISLYTEIVWSYSLAKNFGTNISAGSGYLHAIKDVQVFEMNENGSYEKKKSIGSAQFAAGLQLGFFYRINRANINPISLFADYRFWVQTPFVKEYVPVLPYSTFQIGFTFFIFKK